MRFWSTALSWRTFCARAFTAALAIALLRATLCQSQAADAEPKRVLMLHSFGLRFKPWTTYAEALRTEMSRRKSVDFQDQSLLSARLRVTNQMVHLSIISVLSMLISHPI